MRRAALALASALALSATVPAEESSPAARESASALPRASDSALPRSSDSALPRSSDSALPRDTADAAVVRGSIVFRTYCVLCHGSGGQGDGRAARLYTPRPANLTVSPFGDSYKEMIIRGGGVSVGRSSYMPPWGDELTEEQIHDLVAFLRELRRTGRPANAKG